LNMTGGGCFAPGRARGAVNDPIVFNNADHSPPTA
jgi:hypothetical protein